MHYTSSHFHKFIKQISLLSTGLLLNLPGPWWVRLVSKVSTIWVFVHLNV